MFLNLSASKDTYITNKIIGNKFRATDANVGQAGTLDLFKLYGESTSGSNSTPTEISRLLIKFDLTELQRLSGSKIDVTDASFNAKLIMKDIYGGQTTPSKFKIIAFPLAKSFDEGAGRDVERYSDLDSANFVTASFQSGTPSLWITNGAMKSGSLSDVDSIDVIVSGSLGGNPIALCAEQYFEKGTEDLELDITNAMSGTIVGAIQDHGFCIAYSGSYETDQYTYFVKRFASRDAAMTHLRPRIEIRFNDQVLDNRNNFIFNVSGSLFLRNYHRNVASNLISGSAASTLQGNNCLNLTLKSGSFEKSYNAGQAQIGTCYQAGVYSASFAISSFDDPLFTYLKTANSASFTEIWSVLDTDEVGRVAYVTRSLIINKEDRVVSRAEDSRKLVTITNLGERYRNTDNIRVRVFVEDRSQEVIAYKTPFLVKSQICENMKYRVIDDELNKVVIPFDNATLLSSDEEGMYFDFYMSSLNVGRLYRFEFVINDKSGDQYFTNVASKFIVDWGTNEKKALWIFTTQSI